MSSGVVICSVQAQVIKLTKLSCKTLPTCCAGVDCVEIQELYGVNTHSDSEMQSDTAGCMIKYNIASVSKLSRLRKNRRVRKHVLLDTEKKGKK